MTTAKHDAAAVRRLLARKDRLRRELAEVEDGLRRHGQAVGRAHGYPFPLHETALRRLVTA